MGSNIIDPLGFLRRLSDNEIVTLRRLLEKILSNTAVATLVLPVLAAVADGTDMAPAILMVPAAMAASSGFMLPVSTAPNAIAYGTGRVTIAEMAREGVALNLMLAVVIAGVCYLSFR
jgi:sodium-dependent dicarboxylate transporter 2/3/5